MEYGDRRVADYLSEADELERAGQFIRILEFLSAILSILELWDSFLAVSDEGAVRLGEWGKKGL